MIYYFALSNANRVFRGSNNGSHLVEELDILKHSLLTNKKRGVNYENCNIYKLDTETMAITQIGSGKDLMDKKLVD